MYQGTLLYSIFIAKDLQLVAIKYRYLLILSHQSLASD